MKRENIKRSRKIQDNLESIENDLKFIKSCGERKKNGENIVLGVRDTEGSTHYMYADGEFIPLILLHLQNKHETEHKTLLDELETL